jgi:hypothetical protein
VALCSPLSDFSFQLSAFQLLPNCGFGVAVMSHWVALCSPLSDFSFQLFSFCRNVALGGSARLFRVRGSRFKVPVPIILNSAVELTAKNAKKDSYDWIA